MSEELEALNEMIDKFVEILLEVKCEKPTAVNISYLNNTLRVAFHDKLGIIENALKRLEELELENSEQFKEKWVQDNLAMTFELNVKDKALEILKEKNVHIYNLKTCKSYEKYIKTLRYGYELGSNLITQEEYDLLKEVLL